MHKTFFSLYFFIVASVLIAGWGLDTVWEHYWPEDAVSAEEKDLLKLLAHQYQNTPDVFQKTLADLNMEHDVTVYARDDFAHSQLASRLNLGELVVVHDEQGNKYLYFSQKNAPWVIGVKQPAKTGRPFLYDVLIFLFYAAIALVVLLWVWPLSRDLRKLEAYTRLIGKDGANSDLSIHSTSPVWDLANAFDRMSRRIKSLLNSHQDMTNAVSHELRTPLARMKFRLEMAELLNDPDKMKTQLLGVREDVSEMDDLVNQLLAYAGFEHSQQALDIQVGDMTYLIQDLIARVKERCAPGIEFELIDELGSQRVACEWHLMERAILNLLQNAARFANSHIQVALSCRENRYFIRVSDDGPGVPEAERERVFQSFVRLSNHANAQNRGFGLGLAIVKRIALWHGGDIGVCKSSLGGAQFELSWPLPAQTRS